MAAWIDVSLEYNLFSLGKPLWSGEDLIEVGQLLVCLFLRPTPMLIASTAPFIASKFISSTLGYFSPIGRDFSLSLLMLRPCSWFLCISHLSEGLTSLSLDFFFLWSLLPGEDITWRDFINVASRVRTFMVRNLIKSFMMPPLIVVLLFDVLLVLIKHERQQFSDQLQ